MRVEKTVFALVCLVTATLLAAAPAAAQEPEGASPEMAAMMEAWEKAMTPGEPHQMLASYAGSWKMVGKFWMEPDGEPMVSEGTVERTMLLGGRVLEERVASEMMGKPFEGIGHSGYDNVTGKYWSNWTDSMSTGCFVSEGTRDPESGAVTYTGEYEDPMSGSTVKVRSVMRSEGSDKQVYDWYEDRGEGEAKTMEITYTRQ